MNILDLQTKHTADEILGTIQFSTLLIVGLLINDPLLSGILVVLAAIIAGLTLWQAYTNGKLVRVLVESIEEQIQSQLEDSGEDDDTK